MESLWEMFKNTQLCLSVLTSKVPFFFRMVGEGKINPICSKGLGYSQILKIKGMTIPGIVTFDPGTSEPRKKKPSTFH